METRGASFLSNQQPEHHRHDRATPERGGRRPTPRAPPHANTEGILVSEAAVELGIPEGTVKSRIRRGIVHLRDELRDLL